ncbi:MAG: molybdopterin-dependent oxidoreductase [Dehalococcoidia bacterium]
MRGWSRRQFLTRMGGAAAVGLAGAFLLKHRAFLQVVTPIENPLEFYPNRDWERAYRDVYRSDQSFVFLCAPNDTHNCLLRVYTRRNVAVRIEASYAYGKAVDLYGNASSHRWEPRACNKGLSLIRKFYGDRRVKGAMVRKGFLDWAKADFPRDASTGQPPAQYFNRGRDEWVKLPWPDAFALVAKALVNIAQTYTGPEGQERLRRQGYDPAMIEATAGAGTQTLKFRGGMPFLGATRIFGIYRFANSLALLDAKLRNVGPDKALGARGWDNYSWHTDLPPGHPMVTGQQTVDFDLFTVENAKLVTLWGMNWIATKMPDSHWLTEARLKGTKVITIACEYQSTSNKADEVFIIRPGTDAALALGLAHVIIRDRLYDEAWVKATTDLPLLVRMDTLKLLRASDIIKDYQPAELTNFVRILKPGEAPPPTLTQDAQQVPQALRQEWGDFAVWDSKANAPRVITRDQVGEKFTALGIDPALEGTFTVTTTDGKQVEVRPVFSLVKDYLASLDPKTVSGITWLAPEAIESLARQIAENKGQAILAHGMGPNHFFNNDLKDRALFLVASLTRNIGFMGGTLGSYAGNYRGAYFNGLPAYIAEDPFNPELDPSKPPRVKSYYKMESAHYYNYGDRPLRVGNKLFTGKTHVPTPTKFAWWANSNSILGNIKWAYDVMHNTLPKIECVVVNDWWWTWTCEYADVVFGVDSWAEFKHPDMAGSVSNPFITVFPRTPLPRLFDTKSDMETYAGVASALADLTGVKRFLDYWHFVSQSQVDVYLQRIVDGSTALRGYSFREMEARAKEGIPTPMLTRTYPKLLGWEQSNESRPWYTKTGRAEYYREEEEFIEYGENLPVYREPVDATFYEPNIIVGKPHPALRPATPDKYGLDTNDLRTETRQVRNVLKPWEEASRTQHPRVKDGYRFLFITPKYRHGVHTTPTDIDTVALFFGPFGDPYRRDKRNPWVNEGYCDINPIDAKELGIEDGDYIWIDADPEDRPYRGWKPGDPDYKVSRLLARARYYQGIPRGVLRMWFHMYQASHGTVEAHETRPDGLAKNSRTGYQAVFRYGGHQSTTRAWLRPTLMTDSLVRKEYFAQVIGKGFAPDIHCPVGAPKESFVKVTRAEPGGLGGVGLWRPAALGVRPTYESQEMKRYLEGGFITTR